MPTNEAQYQEWRVGEKGFDAHRMDGPNDLRVRAGDILSVRRPSYASDAKAATFHAGEVVQGAFKDSPRDENYAYFTYDGIECWCLFGTLRKHAKPLGES